jgi:ferredoxin
MRFAVDPAKCQGHARCNLVAPDLFDLDDDGKAFLLVDDVPADQADLALRAVANCPEQAINAR